MTSVDVSLMTPATESDTSSVLMGERGSGHAFCVANLFEKGEIVLFPE